MGNCRGNPQKLVVSKAENHCGDPQGRHRIQAQDYSLPRGPNLQPPQLIIHAEAKSNLDGDPVKKVGPSDIRFYDEEIRHT